MLCEEKTADDNDNQRRQVTNRSLRLQQGLGFRLKLMHVKDFATFVPYHVIDPAHLVDAKEIENGP